MSRVQANKSICTSQTIPASQGAQALVAGVEVASGQHDVAMWTAPQDPGLRSHLHSPSASSGPPAPLGS